MPVIEITKNNFEEEVLNSKLPVIVDFWAAWCGPCKMLSPIVDEIAEENSNIKVCKINVDQENALAAEFGIMSIPTLLIFKNGEIATKSVGVRSKAEILALI